MNIIQSIFLREEKNRELIDHKKLLYEISISFWWMPVLIPSISFTYILYLIKLYLKWKARRKINQEGTFIFSFF